MKNRILLLLGMLLMSFVVSAQQISGTVTSSDDGTPIPGVSVIVKGTTSGTTTDADGKYTVNAEPSAVLIFSFVGYASQEIQVGNSTSLNVSLIPDVQSLQEVVVSALGIRKESRQLGY